jgi:hypothetical protein
MVILDHWASFLLVSMIPGKPWEICSTLDLSFVCLTTGPQLCKRHRKFAYGVHTSSS